jgi:heat shock protein 4
MDTNGDEQPKKTRKVKKQVRKGDLPIVSGTGGTPESVKQAWAERENAMYMDDKLVAETDEKKNELEASIYELRDKIIDDSGIYAETATPEEKKKLGALLEAIDNWLYDGDGVDTTKAIYVAKQDEIRFITGPIIQRYKEAENKKREEEEKAEKAKQDAKKAEEDAKKAEEDAKKEGDAEMQDAPEGEAQGETEEKQ